MGYMIQPALYLPNSIFLDDCDVSRAHTSAANLPFAVVRKSSADGEFPKCTPKNDQ